jgi:hypothetical protein
VKSTWILKNQVDDDDEVDFEVIDENEQKLLDGDYVYEMMSGKSYNCLRIENLRENM